MSTRTITREQAADWGLPHDLTTVDEGPESGTAVELHTAQVDTRRWASVHDVVFRAPDDGKTYRARFFQPLTEHQEHDRWDYADAVALVEVEPVTSSVVEWQPVGDKPEPTHQGPHPEHAGLETHRGRREDCTGPDCGPDEPDEEEPAPTGDHFTEAAIRRSTYLDAANVAAEAGPNTCGCLGCAECARYFVGQQLRRLADHYTSAEQPTGLTWETRADHAIRLYAHTAIERDDVKAENTRLRARVVELEQQAADAPGIRGITPAVVYVDEVQLGRAPEAAEQCAQHPNAPRIGDMCGGCTQYPADMTQPADTPRTITVGHVETALRAWLTDFDYDAHKNLQCGEDDGQDHYPDEATAFFECLVTAVGQAADNCDAEESPEDTIRRYARRLHAVEQLTGGRPGYHTVTVKQLLTAMGDADDEQPEPSEQTPPPAEYSTGPDGEPTYHHSDVDGDRLLISPSFIPGTGPGLYFRTDAPGSSVPADALPTLLARLTTLLDHAREQHPAEEASR